MGDVTVLHELLHGKEDCVLGDSGYTRDRRQHERWESCKASMRAKVEHPFRVIKRQFGYTKVR